MFNIIKKLVSLIVIVTLLTGCIIKRDDLENVDIYTTVYPIEYITDFIYGYNANVSSIYPAEVDLNEYTLTPKQIEDYAKGAIFIYNGLTDEKNIAEDLLNVNNNLKIIDVGMGLEFDNRIEELWLNPRDFLMLATNIKNGLEEYISNKYIIEEIDKNYENLKVMISGFDVEFEIINENAKNKNIIIASDSLNFLSTYGFSITSIDSTNKELSSLALSKAEKLIQDKEVKYIFKLDTSPETDYIKSLKDKGAEIIEVRSMTTKKESDNETGTTYKEMMESFIENVKNEVYE